MGIIFESIKAVSNKEVKYKPFDSPPELIEPFPIRQTEHSYHSTLNREEKNVIEDFTIQAHFTNFQ